MTMIKKCFALILLSVFLVSCGGSKRTTSTRTQPRNDRDLPRSNNSDRPESTLAQGILESGAGKGTLVKKANNHFGIKCHDWKGQKVYHDDDEKGECFRKYSLAKFSYRDHSLFLSGRRRYTDLFKLPKDDYKGWAKGLRAAGYATDKKYPQKLISLIERYKLYRYDGEVLGKEEKDYKKVVDKNDQHTVQKGETLYRISKKYKVSVEDLKKWNSLDSNDIFEGQVLYVQPFDRGY